MIQRSSIAGDSTANRAPRAVAPPMTRILLVRLSSLGDVAAHLPRGHRPRRAPRPDAALDWVVEEAYAAARAHASRRRRSDPVRAAALAAAGCSRRRAGASIGAFAPALRERRYDAMIDAQGLVKSAWSPASRAAACTATAARPRASRWPRGSTTCTLRVSRRSTTRSSAYRKLARAALGYSPTRRARLWHRRAAGARRSRPRGPYCVLLHSTARAEKLWPEEALDRARPRARAARLVCVLPWGDDAERERAGRIAAALAAPSSPPRMSIAEAAGLIGHAAAVVGVDTGLMHLAVALRVPVVGIYCSSEPARTRAASAPGRTALPRRRSGDAPRSTRCSPRWARSHRRSPDAARTLYTLRCTSRCRSLPLRLWWRGRREPGYARDVGERFGRYGARPDAAGHLDPRGVARRDARGAAARRARSRRAYPGARAARDAHDGDRARGGGERSIGECVALALLPYDFPWAVRRFVAHFRPRARHPDGDRAVAEPRARMPRARRAAVARQRAAVGAVGARLRAHRAAGARCAARPRRRRRADRGRRRAPRRARRARRRGDRQPQVRHRAAADDARRAAASCARCSATRPVLLAASTREGEEALLLDALARVAARAARCS